MMSFDEKIDRWGMNLEKTLRSSHNSCTALEEKSK